MFYVQWHITNRCNLRCSHCYHDDYNSELSLDQLKKVFLNVEDFVINKYNDTLLIGLTGGEPLLHPQFKEFVKFLRSRKSVTSLALLTNGILVTEEMAHFLKESGVSVVQVSLDGGTREIHERIRGYGSFDHALRGVRYLKEAGNIVSTQMVVHKNNVNSINELVHLCDQYEIDNLLITRLVNIGNATDVVTNPLLTKEEYKTALELLNSYSKNPSIKVTILKGRQLWRLIDPAGGAACPAGQTQIVILADGCASPCRRLPITVGNLLEKSFFNIWYGSKVLWDLRDRSKLKGKCGRCLDKELCGGCRAVAYSFTNDYLEEDPYCWKEEKI